MKVIDRIYRKMPNMKEKYVREMNKVGKNVYIKKENGVEDVYRDLRLAKLQISEQNKVIEELYYEVERYRELAERREKFVNIKVSVDELKSMVKKEIMNQMKKDVIDLT
tara:strand:+ start:165 stop:491 length:327 start_codon:yes stop_codon:yes gene_type:complete